LTAPARLEAATAKRAIWWQRAAAIRDDWLDSGLTAKPANRATAERAITAIYARIGRRSPAFTWVDSPQAATGLVSGGPNLDDLYRCVKHPVAGRPPLASDLAAHRSQLRAALDDTVTIAAHDSRPPKREKPNDPWPDLPADAALRAGQPFREVVRRSVRDALAASLGAGFYLPVRAATGSVQTQPICWYGQQDTDWIANFEVWRQLGMAAYRPGDEDAFDDWIVVARSSGWWWPAEDVCVVSERPTVIDTRTVPGARHGERHATFIAYRDGWQPLA
jgi:hypothetical protein